MATADLLTVPRSNELMKESGQSKSNQHNILIVVII